MSEELSRGVRYRLVDRESGKMAFPYKGFGHGNYDYFPTVKAARSCNCHDIYQDKEQWRVDEVETVTTLLKQGVDDD